MNYQFVCRFSLLALALTLAKAHLFGMPLKQEARSRSTRDTSYHHFPCVFMSQLIDIKERFKRWLDHDDDGHATFKDVQAFLQKMKPDISDELVSAFIRRRDINGNGAIELIPEYANDYVEGDYGPEAATEWFHLHDTDENGKVSMAEIIHLGSVMDLSPEEARQTALGYYLPMDQDGDGSLDFQEFSKLYELAPPPSAPQA